MMREGLDVEDWNLVNTLLAKANILQKERIAKLFFDSSHEQVKALISQGRLDETMGVVKK